MLSRCARFCTRISSSFITHRRLQLVVAEGVTDVRVCYVCVFAYVCVSQKAGLVASFKPVSNQLVFLVTANLLEGVQGRWCCSQYSGTAFTTVVYLGAAAVDEVGDDVDGRMKGRFVREKMEKTLTRRPAGGREERRRASRLFRISRDREYPGKETMDADADEEACQERPVTETNGEQERW